MTYVCRFGEPDQQDADSCGQSTWVDIHTMDSENRDWLVNQSDLDQRSKDLLLEDVQVTRREKLASGLFVALCGIKHREREDEVVSVCMLIQQARCITVHAQPLPLIKDLSNQIESSHGPRTQIELLARLAVRYAETLDNSILAISAETDDLEDRVLTEGDNPSLGALHLLRHKAFRVRRELVPLRNFLNFISTDQSLQVDSNESIALSAASEQLIRCLEGLDDCRERMQLLHDQIEGQLAATMTRASYNLTIVATVFLPLSFITGLLGMNVAGMPDKHDPRGFWYACAGMVVIAAGSWWLLRWQKWV